MNKIRMIHTFLEDRSSSPLLVPAILCAISLALCLAPNACADSMTGSVTPTGATGLSCVASPPNLIADPDFENGCDTYQSDSEPGHWRFVFDAEPYTGGIAGLPCCAAEFYYLPDEGGSSAGSVDQEVDTTIGQTYEVDLMLATNDVSPGALVTVEFGSTVGLTETNAELGIPADQYMEYSFLGTATDSITDFAVIGTGGTSSPNYEFYLTDVSVTAVENSPEPSTLVLFTAGLICITVGSHRRKGDVRARNSHQTKAQLRREQGVEQENRGQAMRPHDRARQVS